MNVWEGKGGRERDNRDIDTKTYRDAFHLVLRRQKEKVSRQTDRLEESANGKTYLSIHLTNHLQLFTC